MNCKELVEKLIETKRPDAKVSVRTWQDGMPIQEDVEGMFLQLGRRNEIVLTLEK